MKFLSHQQHNSGENNARFVFKFGEGFSSWVDEQKEDFNDFKDKTAEKWDDFVDDEEEGLDKTKKDREKGKANIESNQKQVAEELGEGAADVLKLRGNNVRSIAGGVEKELRKENPEVTEQEIVVAVKSKIVHASFLEVHGYELSAEFTPDMEQEFGKYEDFLGSATPDEWEEKSKEYVESSETLKGKPKGQRAVMEQLMKETKMDLSLWENKEVRSVIRQETFDEDAFDDALRGYMADNPEMGDFYATYVEKAEEISQGNEPKLDNFVENAKLEQKSMTNQLAEEISEMGDGLGVTSVRNYKGNVALFTKDRIPMGGDSSMFIYIDGDGKGQIENDKGEGTEEFDPKKPGEFSTALKNMRYRSMAFYTEVYSKSIHQNFDDYISSDMLEKITVEMDKNTKGVSPEKKFVMMCQKLGERQDVQAIGLGKWMKEKFFNSSEVLSEVARVALQTEISDFIGESDTERGEGEDEVVMGEAAEVKVEKYSG